MCEAIAQKNVIWKGTWLIPAAHHTAIGVEKTVKR